MTVLMTALATGLAIAAHGQSRPIDEQELVERLLSQPVDDDLYDETVYENFIQTISSPLDLNSARIDELRALHVATDEQVVALLAWREASGPLLDIHELQVVPGWDRETIARILPFVRIVDPATRLNSSFLRRVASADTYVVTRYERTLETKRGFRSSSDNRFTGSADKLYLRIRASLPGDFSVGFTGEKDEGESLRFDPRSRQVGFDFTSFHLQLANKGRLQNLIVGDFQAQFAQGLFFGGAFGLGKSGDQISALRKARMGFTPYTSVNESAFRRGVALSISLTRQLNASLFYSGVRRDASIHATDSLESHRLQLTGLHRTQAEIAGRKSLKEESGGLVIQWHRANMDAGILINRICFDSRIGKKETVYGQFSFQGRENLNAGAFVNYTLKNISFFSEVGKSIDGGSGGLAGFLVSADRKLDIAILYRKYQRDFHTFYSNALSENTGIQNEEGIYWSWKYAWNRRASFGGYVDLFKFPWLGFRRYKPSDGHEWLLRFDYRPSREIHIFTQLREESKLLNLPPESGIYKAGERLRHNLSVNIDAAAGKSINLKSRVQYSAQKFNAVSTEGWVFIQDISVRFGRLEVGGRHAIFETDHYDNRHYVYERDAWSSYSMPAYAGVGVRNYALIEYKFNKNLIVWVRYARTRMLSGGQIGAGEETIDGNTRNDVKFQARLAI